VHGSNTRNLSVYCISSSLQQNRRTRGQNRFCLEGGVEGDREGGLNNVYTHVSKCKNDKIKKKEIHPQA
jgi:hypothetical protein